MPALVGLQHVELQESAGQLLILPGRGGLAGTEADDRVLHADRHARLHPDVADDAVSLVEERDDRDALRHRRHVRVLARACPHLWKLDAIALVFVLALAACGKQQRQQRAGNGGASHAQSGVQAW